MMAILKLVLGWATGPVFDGILKGYQAKLQNDTDKTKLAGELAARELAVQQVEIQAQSTLKLAQIGHMWEPEKLAMYITLIYYGKVVIWDIVLESWTGGSTDPLRGQVAVWAQLIMTCYFGKRTIESALRIWKN